MTDGSQAVTDVRDTIIEAITATTAPTWRPDRPAPGVAAATSVGLIKVIAARVTRRASRQPDA